MEIELEYLTVEQAAFALDCHISTIYRYIKRYQLKIYKPDYRPKMLLLPEDILNLKVPKKHKSSPLRREDNGSTRQLKGK